MRPSVIMRLVPALSLAASLGAQGAARPAARPLPPPDRVPSLVVFITVDQLREDYFTRFSAQLTGGLGRLARGGAFFTNAMLDYATTETAPGHATGMSGRFPRNTGIVSNTLGVYDPQAPMLGSSTQFASPFRFRGGTLIDWLRIKDARSMALSVSRKDRGAILPLGRAHQSVYWYDGANGAFNTSIYYADSLPTWVRTQNARLRGMYVGAVWQLLLPDSSYAERDSVIYENFGNDIVFPHPLPVDTTAALRALPETPFIDDVTLQVALSGMKNLNLGVGEWTDVLAISLSATDAVGHKYGPDSREMHDNILRLDRALGTFMDSLFAVRDSTRVVFALTADHAVAPIPELYTATTHRPTQRLDLTSVAKRYQTALVARGASPVDFSFSEAMLSVQRGSLERAGINVDSVLRAFRAEVRALPGVARVDRLADLPKDTLRDPVARRWYHSVPPDYPVELVVTLQPYSVWGTYAPGIHGSPYDYDNHVPVILYGAPFKAGQYRAPVRVVDMAPTLAWVAGVPPAERVDGSVLWVALK